MRSRGDAPISPAVVQRILIRATNWVGDAVMTLPALQAVRDNFPESRVTVMARPWVIPVYEGHPAADELMEFDKGTGTIRGSRDLFRTAKSIRKRQFDLAILLQNAFEAALLARAAGIRFRVGYAADGRGFLLTHAVKRTSEVRAVHQVEYYLNLLRFLGWRAPNRDPSLVPSPVNQKSAETLLHAKGVAHHHPLVGLSPGAIYGRAKRWPPERFAALGDWAVDSWGAKVVILGSPGEAGVCTAVDEAMVHRPLNLCGETPLGVAMGVIGRCRLFVSNDSGLMHVAAALGVPTVAVFGSTDAVATGPRSPRARVVQHDTDCAPCLKPECPQDYRCMLSITPEEVWQAMASLWEDE